MKRRRLLIYLFGFDLKLKQNDNTHELASYTQIKKMGVRL